MSFMTNLENNKLMISGYFGSGPTNHFLEGSTLPLALWRVMHTINRLRAIHRMVRKVDTKPKAHSAARMLLSTKSTWLSSTPKPNGAGQCVGGFRFAEI